MSRIPVLWESMVVLKWLLIIAVVGYLGLLTLMYLFQRSLMYFPDAKRTPPAAAGLPQAEEVALTSSDGEKLVAWHVAPKGEKRLVIYFQGNAGGLDLRAGRFKWLIADGTGLLALSYRGFGGSSGKPSEAGFIRDAIAAYDFAVARYSSKRIVVWGESLGTAVATALASQRDVGALILDAPFTSAVDVGAAAYPFVPVRWFMKDTYHSDERIVHLDAPLLVLHGEQDRVVPIAFGERLFKLAPEPKRMVRFPLGGHVNLDDFGAADEVRAFLGELRPPGD
jgi:fermentation-respiration switch protein FrsA (DUF1100 family)